MIYLVDFKETCIKRCASARTIEATRRNTFRATIQTVIAKVSEYGPSTTESS